LICPVGGPSAARLVADLRLPRAVQSGDLIPPRSRHSSRTRPHPMPAGIPGGFDRPAGERRTAMSGHTLDDIRNVALVGHGASGKTSLADQLLLRSGAIRPNPSNNGAAYLDSADEERARHMSIFSHLAHFEHHGRRINLIDTPGYPDFVGQMVGALRAVETAVIVVNAATGIEPNTRRAFQIAGEEHLARMIVVNKCDQDHSHPAEILSRLRETFGSGCVALNVPCGAGPGLSRVVNVIASPESADDCPIDPRQAHQELIEAIVEADEELMAKYFEG